MDDQARYEREMVAFAPLSLQSPARRCLEHAHQLLRSHAAESVAVLAYNSDTSELAQERLGGELASFCLNLGQQLQQDPASAAGVMLAIDGRGELVGDATALCWVVIVVSDGARDLLAAAPMTGTRASRELGPWQPLSPTAFAVSLVDRELTPPHDAATHALLVLQPAIRHSRRRFRKTRGPVFNDDGTSTLQGSWRFRTVIRPPEPVLAPIRRDLTARFDARVILGLNESEAEQALRLQGCVMRVIERDGVPLNRTSDFRPNRVNVAVYNRTVVSLDSVN